MRCWIRINLAIIMMFCIGKTSAFELTDANGLMWRVEHDMYCYDTPVGLVVGDTQGSFENARPAIDPRTVGDVTIPSSFLGFGNSIVTAIGEGAFNGCQYLTSIIIPEGVVRIESGAFRGCSSLTKVVLPSTLSEVGYDIFEDCWQLTTVEIHPGNKHFRIENNCLINADDSLVTIVGRVKNLTIPDGVVSIEWHALCCPSDFENITIPTSLVKGLDEAFVGCCNLRSLSVAKENPVFRSENGCLMDSDGRIIAGATASGRVEIPVGAKGFARGAFEGCVRLREVVLPTGLECIGVCAFKGCCNLTRIEVPSGVASIDSMAFEGCSRLPSIVIPGTVKKIGSNAFHDCIGLSELVLEEGIEKIEMQAFWNCVGLRKIEIPSTVHELGHVFLDCSGIETVVLHEGIQKTMRYAFSDCVSLKELHIPASLTSIGDGSFNGSAGLRSITVAPGNPVYHVENNCLVDNRGHLVLAATSSGNLIIPSCVSRLCEDAFLGCYNLTSVVFSASINEIPWRAFYGTGLTEIDLPPSIRSIARLAFCGCERLTRVKIPASVTKIDIDEDKVFGAFRECPLMTIEIDSANSRYCVRNGGIFDKIDSLYVYEPFLKVEILGTSLRDGDPGVVDIAYRLRGAYEHADVLMLAFVGDALSWSNVLRPRTFIETEEGSPSVIGVGVPCNTINNISWRASEDVLPSDLHNIQVRLYAKPKSLLPLETREITDESLGGRVVVSVNQLSLWQIEDAIYWLYASGDPSLSLVNGKVLWNGQPLLPVWKETECALRGMGFSMLSEDQLAVVNSKHGMSLNAISYVQYGYAEVSSVGEYDQWTGVVLSGDRWIPHFTQAHGAVVDDEFVPIFEEPIARGQVVPYVADITGDGLWDLVLVCAGEKTNLFENVGTLQNPSFRMFSGSEAQSRGLIGFDWNTNSFPRLRAGATLDIWPAQNEGISVGYYNNEILIGTAVGAIWHYVDNCLDNQVWGGSASGIGASPMVAAVDWDGDGDMDCLCGTADGRLHLIIDPATSVPEAVSAEAGVDSVVLRWAPSSQSSVVGYRVYRTNGETGSDKGANWSIIGSPSLPTYRDYPPTIGDYDYKVSSVSRFYTAGNSTPIETESPATEAVRASLGTVKFFWNDVVVKQGENAHVMLSIENSLNYDVAGKTQVVAYDPAYLTPLKIVKTGLTENVIYEESVADGKWTITLKSGKLAAGGGKFFTLVFDTLKAGTTKVGEATVTILEESAPYQLGDVNGDGKVDELDVRLLAQLKNAAGRKWTAQQLKAGDFNGNGKLDNADYQALRELLKEKGLL